MLRTDKIYVAGHRGLVGSALLQKLTALGFKNIVAKTHEELDLTNRGAVESFFGTERPEHVFLAAAKVGGILANSSKPAEFIFQNIAIQTNVIHAAWRSGVKRLLFLGSSCIYPRDCLQPIKEKYLLSGPLEPTNRPYAVAKIAGIEMCSSYNRQYGTRFLAVMPTNLFGPRDNYDLQTSHVLPALIRKAHEAKANRSDVIEVWGTGKPRREFLYSDDMADACVYVMSQSEEKFRGLLQDGEFPLINIGTGRDIPIGELAELVADIIGFSGKVQFDLTKPDGTPQKLLDISRLSALGWTPTIGLRDGILRCYKEYLSRQRDSPD